MTIQDRVNWLMPTLNKFIASQDDKKVFIRSLESRLRSMKYVERGIVSLTDFVMPDEIWLAIRDELTTRTSKANVAAIRAAFRKWNFCGILKSGTEKVNDFLAPSSIVTQIWSAYLNERWHSSAWLQSVSILCKRDKFQLISPLAGSTSRIDIYRDVKTDPWCRAGFRRNFWTGCGSDSNLMKLSPLCRSLALGRSGMPHVSLIRIHERYSPYKHNSPWLQLLMSRTKYVYSLLHNAGLWPQPSDPFYWSDVSLWRLSVSPVPVYFAPMIAVLYSLSSAPTEQNVSFNTRDTVLLSWVRRIADLSVVLSEKSVPNHNVEVLYQDVVVGYVDMDEQGAKRLGDSAYNGFIKHTPFRVITPARTYIIYPGMSPNAWVSHPQGVSLCTNPKVFTFRRV